MADYNIRAIISATDKGFSSTIDAAQASLNKFGRNAAKSTQSVSDKVNTLNSSFKSMAAAIGVMQAVSKAVEVVASSVGAAVKRVDTLSNANRVFQNMGFSAQETSKMMDGLKASIQGLPTALDDAVQGVQMIASATGDLGKSQKVYSALNDAIIGFGGSTADVKNAVLQLSQAFANGKIDGMTWISMMNSQMGPVLTALAKKFHMTTGELQDALSSGQISVQQFQDALIELDTQGGGGLASLHKIALDATSGIQTAMENTKTAITRGLATIINAINSGLQAANLPTIAQMISSVGTAAENVLNKIAGAIPSVISGLASLTGGLQPLQPIIKGVTLAFAGLFGAILASGQINSTITLFKNLGAGIAALNNPITIAVVAVGLIVAAFVKAYNSSATFRNGINQVVQALSQVDFSGFSAAVQGVISTISGALKPAIDGIGKSLGSINWSSVATSAQNVFQAVINVVTVVVNFIRQIVQAVADVIQGFNSVGGSAAVLETVKNVVEAIFKAFQTVIGIVGGVISSFVQFGNQTNTFQILGQAIGLVVKAIAKISEVLSPIAPAIGYVAAAFVGWIAAKGTIAGISTALWGIVHVAASVLTSVYSFGAGIVAAFAKVGPAVMKVIGFVKQLAPAFSAIVRVATMMGSGVMRAFSLVRNGIMIAMNAFKAFTAIMMANPFVAIIAGITLLVTALVLFFTKTEMGRQMWQNFVTFLTSLWQGLVATAQAVWTAIGTALTTIWTTIVTTAQAIWQGLVTFFTTIWTAIQTVAQTVWTMIQTVIQTAITIISTIITTVLTTIQAVWTAIWTAIQTVAQTIWTAIQTVIQTVITVISSIISATLSAIQAVWSAIWNAIKAVATAVWNGIKSAVTSAINAVKSVITSVMNAIKSVMTSIWNAIKSVTSSVWNGIKSVVSSGINAAKSVVSSAMHAMSSVISSVWGTIRGVFSAGVGFIRSVVHVDLSGNGRAIMNSFLNGLKAVWNSIKSFVSGIAGWIKSHKGPISYDRRLLIPAGKAMMIGFNAGLEKEFRTVQSNVAAIAGTVADVANANLSAIDTSPLTNGLNDIRRLSSQTIGASVTGQIQHDLTLTAQPAYINLSLGGSNWSAYVDDISREQGSVANLNSNYRF